MPFVIESLLFFLILFPPLIHGGITILPLSVIECTGFLLFFSFLSLNFFKKKISFVRISFLPAVLFILLILFQLLPLPKTIISLISPATASLYQKFAFNSLNAYTISIYADSTINILLQFLTSFFVFFVALNYIDDEKKIKRLIFAIIISGFIYSFYGIIKRLAILGPEFSTFTNRNHFSAYVQMIIPLAITYSLAGASRLLRYAIIFMASVMTLGLFLCLSRAGIISFFLSAFLLLLLLRAKKSIRNRISIIIIIVLILSVIIGIAGLSPVIQRLGTLRSPLEPLTFRLDLIKDSLKIIKDFPLWGIGFGALGEVFQKYRSVRIPESFSFSHNEPAQLLAETGITGFFLVFLFLFFYIKKILALFFRRHNVRVIYITLGCLIGLFSITLHSLFDFVFHVPANALLFCIILALVFRVIYLKEPQDLLPVPKSEMELPVFLRISCMFILSIFLISAVSLIWGRFQAETIFEKIKDYKFSEDSMRATLEYKRVLKKVDKAIAGNPKSSLYRVKKADIISELALRQDLKDYLISFEDFKDRGSALSLASDNFKKAINLNPTKADFHLRLGWLNSVLENKALARDEFEKAILLDPQNAKIKSYVNDYLKDNE